MKTAIVRFSCERSFSAPKKQRFPVDGCAARRTSQRVAGLGEYGIRRALFGGLYDPSSVRGPRAGTRLPDSGRTGKPPVRAEIWHPLESGTGTTHSDLWRRGEVSDRRGCEGDRRPGASTSAQSRSRTNLPVEWIGSGVRDQRGRSRSRLGVAVPGGAAPHGRASLGGGVRRAPFRRTRIIHEDGP